MSQGCTNRCSLAAGLRGNEERMRKWRGNGERMRKLRGNGEKLTLYIPQFSLHFFPLSPFPLSLSISYIKIGHIMLQNVKYGTFVANVSQILTYELWGNNSGSNLLRGSSASCAGLGRTETTEAAPPSKNLFNRREEVRTGVKTKADCLRG